MVALRHSSADSQRTFLTGCYWLTYIPIRLVLYPYLLTVFPGHLISIGVRLVPAIRPLVLCRVTASYSVRIRPILVTWLCGTPQVPTWELVSVTALQLVLCLFNVYVTWRALRSWSRNRKAARVAASAAGSAPSGSAAAPVQPCAAQPAAPRQYDVGMAPPTAHIAITGGGGRAWSPAADDITAAKRSAQDAYGQHVQNAARQRKALQRAQEEQNSSFSGVMAGSKAVRVC